MAKMNDSESPLCVDLDGTLIRTDLLVESMLALVHRNPLNIFAMLGWMLRGKAYLKRQIARRVQVDAATLPYNEALLQHLREQAPDREMVLVTASDRLLAEPVAEHLGMFGRVLASDGEVNLSGARKAALLVESYGERGFDYAGNAAIDLKVWKHARSALVVGSQRLAARAAAAAPLQQHFGTEQGGLRTWFEALRMHQWIKNLLIFLPLLASHRVFQELSLSRAAFGFLCFGLCASGVYLLNDLLDLPADRRHPRKRKRPFAAGRLPLAQGLVLTLVLTLAAFGMALWLSPRFALVLLGYYVLTTAYSFLLKRIAMLDVIVLAALYTLRIIAGTAAIRVPISFWLLAFSMFLFLSLAILKRYTELLTMRNQGRDSAHGRGYGVGDLALLQSMGTSSGYLSVLVLALYINSTASMALYHRPQVLWLLCPILLYWISRAWMVAHRDLMHDDPVVFAVVDRTSRVLFVLAAAIVAGAI